MEFSEKFINRNIAELSKEYSLHHAASINTNRIAPILIDGLKLVARRILYIMYLKDQGLKYRKVASISGDAAARVHHHGQISLENSLVGLAQSWNNIIPLIDGYGNYGTTSGDPAAASRYILAKISDYAYACFFEDFKDSSVDMVIGADGETKEPLYLPAKYPNILLNGTMGLGVGLATNIPCYNFKEVIETTILLMKNPNAPFVLIPDSPTGADIIENDFRKICETGRGVYSMRCKYDIDSDTNTITFTALPYLVTVNNITKKIGEIKDNGGLPELINMHDYSGENVNLQLFLRNDVNPYKFIRKLIDTVNGLERSYAVNITLVDDFQCFDWSIRQVLIEWIKYRREQKRVMIIHRRSVLYGEQRSNDVKLFIMKDENLNNTIEIFKTSRNRMEIEKRLIEKYLSSEIRMDSLQARVLSEMRMHELSLDSYQRYLKRKDEILKELEEVNQVLNEHNGIDNVIIKELRDGSKRFGSDRKSNVVPIKISSDTEIIGLCNLQLSSDGNILRSLSTNVDEEPVPLDPLGFAIKVDNDSSLIAIDENGLFSFIKAKELPLGTEVPVNRFIREKLSRIITLLPYDTDSENCCTLISAHGLLKKFMIKEMKPSKKPCIDLAKGDVLIKGIVTKKITNKDILIYTEAGLGQRINPNNIRITSYSAKGTLGFKLKDDKIIGAYLIDPRHQYLIYVTSRGKGRKNRSEYLPKRNDKNSDMVKLITVSDRETLLAVVGCDNSASLQMFCQDGSDDIINISKIPEGTMSSLPVKITSKNMTTNKIVRVKII